MNRSDVWRRCHGDVKNNQKEKRLGKKFRFPLELNEKGSLSNGVDDLESFTSEMEWSFFVPVGFSCVFSNWYSYVSTPPAFPLAWIHV